jgi:hypothetical protein
MRIGTIFDYDYKTNTWLTITDTNNQWLTALIHVLRSEPEQHPFYAQYGIAALDAVQTGNLPMHDLMATQQQFSRYFKILILTQPNPLEPKYTITYQFFDDSKPSQLIVDLDKYKATT